MPRRMFLKGLAATFSALLACSDPSIAIEKFRAFETGTLGALQDGRTTRQEILLKFGTPSATFEGERILTYDFVRDPQGEWRRVGTVLISDWRFNFIPGSCSLVLVFGPDGLLVRHGLVKEREGNSAGQRESASPKSDLP